MVAQFRVTLCALVAALALLPNAGVAEERKSSQLADACERHDRPLILRLLADESMEIDTPQVDGMRAVHWLVFHRDHDLLKRLLRLGASASEPSRFGATPMSIACSAGDADSVKILLDSGGAADAALPSGESMLMLAVRTGNTDVVETLLAAGAKPNDSIRGQTALMWAAAAGHVEVVDQLLEAKADVTATLDSGFSPIAFAVRAGHVKVVERLLDESIDINASMKPKKRNPKSVRSGTSLLMLAVENGHFELAVQLIQRGADPNDQRSGFTPLHAMTWVRKPNRGDGADGQAPPESSGRMGALQFVRQLVKHGADVNARLKRGESGRGRLNLTGATPFLMASKTADMELLKLLHALGADPRIPNVDGAAALMAAAGLGTKAPFEEAGTEDEALAVAEWLIDLGADVNRIDRNGETAMHGAAYKNLPKMVALLARNGAKIEVWNRKNKFGWTPLLIAEGHRPGNFKPSFETIAAIHRLMRAEGLTPPPPTPRKKRVGY